MVKRRRWFDGSQMRVNCVICPMEFVVFILLSVLFTNMEVLGRHHNNTITRP